MGTAVPQRLPSQVVVILLAVVVALFAPPSLAATVSGSNASMSAHAKEKAAIERMQLLLLEASAGKKVDLGDLSGLGFYAPIIRLVVKRVKILQVQSMLLRQRIADARISEALSLNTFRSPTAIRAAEARIRPLFPALEGYQSAVETYLIQTPKDIAHANVPRNFKSSVLHGFASTAGITRKIVFKQVEAIRKLAEHCVTLLTFLNATAGRYIVHGGHILFSNPSDLKVFQRDAAIIRADFFAIKDRHRQVLELIHKTMDKTEKVVGG